MTADVAGVRPGLLRRFAVWAATVGLERKLAAALLGAALVSGLATYLAMTGAFARVPDPETVLLLLLLDLVLLLLLGTVVARRLVALWLQRRRGLAGARLHARLVLLFSLVAVTPTIIVAVFSALFLNVGMDTWFSDRVRTAVKDSLVVAEAYVKEHQQSIGADAVAMASALNRKGPLLDDPAQLERMMDLQYRIRGLSEAIVVDRSSQVLASVGYSLVASFDPDVPKWAFDRAAEGEVVLLPSELEDRVRALVALDEFGDAFLLIGRVIDPRVLGHLDKTSGAARLYERLEGKKSGLQIAFAVIFFIVALLLLCAAIWVALVFATQLVRPIGRLVAATDRIASGDLTARVPESQPGDEIGSLSRAFNRMGDELEGRRDELVQANRQLEERNRFTALVLAGVSAGVIGLDEDGRINLPNRSASELLEVDLTAKIGAALGQVVPEMGGLLETAKRRPGRIAEGQINLVRGGQVRTLLVRVAAETGEAKPVGFVVTFDDVTALLSAQRMAAWADVARRIAHEIKNPLTPIQLSAERLKRKYLKDITTDPETFSVCTDTIIRQVGDIGRMVDEFSSFARMPAPAIRPEPLDQVCRQAVFLQQSAHPGIRYTTTLSTEPILLPCDRRQVSQALTNLLQNAAESIEARLAEEPGGPPGEVMLRLHADERRVVVAVEDNGRGLPVEERARLTEPYVTTRPKGTGLGLAIVKKVMEDHGGELRLEDGPGGGASVKLAFQVPAAASDELLEPPLLKAAAHGA